MMKLLYLDAFSGISGDMLLGALIDSGYSPESLQKYIDSLKIGKVRLESSKTMKGPISATAVKISDDSGTKALRHLSDIRKILDGSDLNEEVRTVSLEVFRRIAEAEARIHGTTMDEVHFHEVGAVDSLVDVCCTVAALHDLNINKIFCSPLPVARGFISGSHGIIPLPAPAAGELMKNMPLKPSDAGMELVTPTGAALVSVLATEFGNIPEMTLISTGYGAGTANMKIPNVLRIFMGEIEDGRNDAMIVLESNIDDMSGEIAGYLMDKILTAGAMDVSYSPLQMKKNRPGFKVTVLCERSLLTMMSEILFSESTTAGIRYYPVERLVMARESREVETPYGPVRIKDLTYGTGIHKRMPEYEDCRLAAEKFGVPLRVVMKSAERLAEK